MIHLSKYFLNLFPKMSGAILLLALAIYSSPSAQADGSFLPTVVGANAGDGWVYTIQNVRTQLCLGADASNVTKILVAVQTCDATNNLQYWRWSQTGTSGSNFNGQLINNFENLCFSLPLGGDGRADLHSCAKSADMILVFNQPLGQFQGYFDGQCLIVVGATSPFGSCQDPSATWKITPSYASKSAPLSLNQSQPNQIANTWIAKIPYNKPFALSPLASDVGLKSFNQDGYLLEQSVPDSDLYNVCGPIFFGGNLSIAQCQLSLSNIAADLFVFEPVQADLSKFQKVPNALFTAHPEQGIMPTSWQAGRIRNVGPNRCATYNPNVVEKVRFEICDNSDSQIMGSLVLTLTSVSGAAANTNVFPNAPQLSRYFSPYLAPQMVGLFAQGGRPTFIDPVATPPTGPVFFTVFPNVAPILVGRDAVFAQRNEDFLTTPNAQ